MLKAITNVLSNLVSPAEVAKPDQREHELQLATALLLVEIARADYSMELTERAAIDDLLAEHFSLSQEEVNGLVKLAETQSDHSACLHEFTRQLVHELSIEEKHHIVEMLWRVAYADDELSKFEDSLVRKIAELLYVSHRNLIQIRNRVVGI